MKDKSAGFTLIEVVLALVVSILVVITTVLAYNSFSRTMRYERAKTILSAIRTGIEDERSRTNAYPAATGTYSVSSNKKTNNQAYYGNYSGPLQGDCNMNGAIDATESSLPCDPMLNKSKLTLGTVAVGTTAAGTAGGWLYDSASGEFRINLPDVEYGLTGTVRKYPESPSRW